jgi:hypothetical protein
VNSGGDACRLAVQMDKVAARPQAEHPNPNGEAAESFSEGKWVAAK